MSEKQTKRIRRQIRREQNMLLQKTLKPKPKFVPMWFWMMILKFFLKVEK